MSFSLGYFFRKDLPAVKRQPVDLGQVRVVYRDIVIDNDNIDRYRWGCVFYGEAEFDTNRVIVYRYTLAPGIELSPSDRVYRILNKYPNDNAIIAHEMKHFKNQAYADFPSLAKNLHEIMLFYGMNEVSARTAECFSIRDPEDLGQVFAAALSGVNDVLNDAYYTRKFADRLVQILRCRFNFSSLMDRRQIKRAARVPFDFKYSAEFHQICDDFFTIGPYRLWENPDALPRELQDKFQELKTNYVEETRRILRDRYCL